MKRSIDGIRIVCAAILCCALAVASVVLGDPPTIEVAPVATPNAPSTAAALPAAAATAPATATTSAAAPRSWELSPYRIQILMRVNSAAGWTATRRRDFTANLKSRAQVLIGGVWQLTVVEAPPGLPWDHATEFAGVAPDSLPASALDFDKVILLDVKPSIAETTLWAREFDVRARLWSPPQTRLVEAAADLTQATLRTLWTVFRPVARIDSVPTPDGPQEAALRLQGGDLPLGGHGLELARPGSAWQPIVRHTDAAGHTLSKGVYLLPWTWLQTLRTVGSLAQCRMVSAIGDPIDLHYDGRTEYLALAVNARSGKSTEVTVLADGAGDRPLEDLEVLSREGDGPLKPVGRTDANGRLSISSEALSLLTVYIRSGDELLLRLPLLCGVEPSATVRVEDNGRRPATARLVADASGQLLDLAAQQQLLVARFQRQIVAGKSDEAEATLAALSSLPTSEKFASSLDAQKAGLVILANDPAAAAWLDKQLTTVKTLVARNLIDGGTLGKLHDALIAARSK